MRLREAQPSPLAPLPEGEGQGVRANSTPGVAGVGDLLDFLLCQFPVHPVHHTAHLARVDEEHLATEDEVGPEIGEPVVVEGVAVGDLAADAADSEIHLA
jgi:hypothetical protein